MVPREKFEHELSELLEQIEAMSDLVERTYERLMDAVEKKDEAVLLEIMKSDTEFYDMKKQIEGKCLRLITKQQPIASDLRIITSVMKIVTDIERVGDHAGDIGELMIRTGMKDLDKYSVHLEGMIRAANELFSNAIDAFVESDMEASDQVIKDDDIVDALFNKVKVDLIAGLKEESGNEDEYIDMLMLAKYLEKIGDHAVNIAKWQIFRTEGKLV